MSLYDAEKRTTHEPARYLPVCMEFLAAIPFFQHQDRQTFQRLSPHHRQTETTVLVRKFCTEHNMVVRCFHDRCLLYGHANENLGPEYTVWDKSATIRYLKPGRTDVTAEYLLTEEDLESIKKAVAQDGKLHWMRKVEIKDANGEVIAEVDKVISIRKKQKAP